MTETNRITAGRFVAKTATQTIHGLSAEEAVDLIEKEGDGVTELFVIHRVLADGRLELAGVNPSALKTRDCIMFSRNTVADARRDYDRMLDYANGFPPPCRIDMRFGHAREMAPSHIVILVFPNACQTAVGNWLNNAPFEPGDVAEGSRHVLEAFESSVPQIVMSTTLEPQP